MVVSFERSLHLRQPFTSDLRAAFSALDEIEDLSAFGVQDQAERDKVLRLVAGSDRFVDAEPVVDAYAKAAHDDLKRSIGALRELVAPLAGLPGRKALLYVSDGIPMVAGADLFRLLDTRFRDSTRGNLLALRYSARNDFRRLIDSANANRVTFYTIEASGSEVARLAVGRVAHRRRRRRLADRDRHGGRHEPRGAAGDDGGRHRRVGGSQHQQHRRRPRPAGRRSALLLLARLLAGPSRRRSLAPHRGPGQRPRAAGPAPPQLPRQAPDTRLTESVLAALRYGAGANPLDLRVDVARRPGARRRSLPGAGDGVGAVSPRHPGAARRALTRAGCGWWWR